jgi:hypothetical protein
MNTINRKKSVIAAVGAAVAATAVPALLFAGAGTAQAYTGVKLIPDNAGVTVHIQSVGLWGKGISSGSCSYTAVPQVPGTGVPIYGYQFNLPAKGSHDLWFPVKKTGATWDISIHCQIGTDSTTQHLVY